MIRNLIKRLRPNKPNRDAASNTVSLGEARIPNGHRVYVIGDIHGRADLLAPLHSKIDEDARSTNNAIHIVYLGDYVDRGLQSRQVIDCIAGFDIQGATRIELMGNHEEVMLAFIEDPVGHADWLDFGGDATLLSYGVETSGDRSRSETLRTIADDLQNQLPATHLDFLNNLQDSYQLGDYLFVHAGIDPRQPLSQQSTRSLRWMREPFLSNERRYEKVIVHGHTVVDKPQFRHNRIAIDTGAYYSGRLSCLVLEDLEFRMLPTAS